MAIEFLKGKGKQAEPEKKAGPSVLAGKLKSKTAVVEQEPDAPKAEQAQSGAGSSFLAGKLKKKTAQAPEEAMVEALKEELEEEVAKEVAEEMAGTPATTEQEVENVQVVDIKLSSATEMFTGKTSVSKTEEEEVLGQVIATERMANIGMKVGQRINLGDYNSANLEVSLHYPCKVTELDDTYSFVKEWLDKKMESLLAEVSSDLTP